MRNLDIVMEILSSIFYIQQRDIKDEMTPEEIEKWDSITHMDLLAKFEETFKIQFDMEEINEMQSIGQIKAMLVKKGVTL